MMNNFFADVRKRGDFLKSYHDKLVNKLHSFAFEP